MIDPAHIRVRKIGIGNWRLVILQIDRYLLSYSRSLNEFDNGGIDLMNYNMIKP